MAEENIYKFTVNFTNGDETEIEYPITNRERSLIIDSMRSQELFSEVEELSDLYDRVYDATSELIEDAIKNGTGDFSVMDNMDFELDFGDEIED